MKVGILGYGKEGQSAEKYFSHHGAETQVFDHFTTADLDKFNFDRFDLILRSPSVHPRPQFSSMTQYFFTHCPCPIIGVTGTKGKGTTSSLITSLLTNLHFRTFLVGNIGNPALDVLDQLQSSDVVIYELSSFQLWDLQKSPHIAVILGIEPDHLNVHDDFDDYCHAKSNIAKHQTREDTCIYYRHNPYSTEIAHTSPGAQIPYPVASRQTLDEILSQLAIPGQHNRDNAEAALLAVSSYLNLPLEHFITEHRETIIKTFQTFQGLPHRLQFLRELHHVKYYDDNFSTNPASLEVALKAFPRHQIILIAGGRDKTNNQDLPEIASLITSTPNLVHTVFIGESGQELVKLVKNSTFATDLPSAVHQAQQHAESLSEPAIVLMSPAAASFDMFQNVYDRGAVFQQLVQELK